jgi:hypothetical protein
VAGGASVRQMMDAPDLEENDDMDGVEETSLTSKQRAKRVTTHPLYGPLVDPLCSDTHASYRLAADPQHCIETESFDQEES